MKDSTPVEVPRVIVRNNKIPAKLGAQVIYVLAERDSVASAGRCRPGVIVDLVVDGSVDGLANIMVFTNAGIDQLPNTHHAKEILHDEDDKKPGTWHWPPPRELVFQSVEVHGGVPADEPESPDDFNNEDDAPFPTTPETGSRLAAHIAERGYHVGEAREDLTPELFTPEEPDSR